MGSPPMQRLDRCSPRPYARSEYAGRAGWKVVESTVVRWSPRRAAGWRRWWLNRFGAVARGAVQPGVRVWHPWLLELGAWSMLADGVEVYNLGKVTIGDHTVVSQRAFLCAGTHDHRKADLPLVRSEIVIGDGVWIAAEAFIGPGVTIGDGAVVGARAVVTKDVPAHAIVAGNPAVVVGERQIEEAGAEGGEA